MTAPVDVQLLCQPCREGDHQHHLASMGGVCIGCVCPWRGPHDDAPAEPQLDGTGTYGPAGEPYPEPEPVREQGPMRVAACAFVVAAAVLVAVGVLVWSWARG